MTPNRKYNYLSTLHLLACACVFFIWHNAAVSCNLCGGVCVRQWERSEHAHKRHRVNCRSAPPCYVLFLRLLTLKPINTLSDLACLATNRQTCCSSICSCTKTCLSFTFIVFFNLHFSCTFDAMGNCKFLCNLCL